MRTPLTHLLLVLATAATLSACGGNDTTATGQESPAAGSPAASSAAPTANTDTAPEGTVVDVTIAAEDISPRGERVDADLGEPVTLVITSDRAGELHVHSTPEQEVEFRAGTTRKKLTFDQPGVVEVEDHESGTVIVQLQVS